MGWFNYYGLICIAVIMVPNIFYALKSRQVSGSRFTNKALETAEQIGRYGCMVLMIFNIPYTYFGFWFEGAIAVYISVNAVLCLVYCVLWVIFFNREGKAKALSLSVIPTVVFIFSGCMLADIPLIVLAVVFGVCHIYISYKNSTV